MGGLKGVQFLGGWVCCDCCLSGARVMDIWGINRYSSDGFV